MIKIHMDSGDRRRNFYGPPYTPITVCRRVDVAVITDDPVDVTCKQCLVRMNKKTINTGRGGKSS